MSAELIPSPEETGEVPTRKGRSNAILTYEKVAELLNAVSYVRFKIDTIQDGLAKAASTHQDHEARLRALELFQAGVTAARSAQTEGRKDTQWGVTASIALAGWLVAAGSFLITFYKLGH